MARTEKDLGKIIPYIGDNGNWFIGQKDTGILANISIYNENITLGEHTMPHYKIQKVGNISIINADGIGYSLQSDTVYRYSAIFKNWILDVPGYMGDTEYLIIAESVFEILYTQMGEDVLVYPDRIQILNSSCYVHLSESNIKKYGMVSIRAELLYLDKTGCFRIILPELYNHMGSNFISDVFYQEPYGYESISIIFDFVVKRSENASS